MSSLETYDGTPIGEIIARSIPWTNDSDVFVFLMGPYRIIDPSYLYSEGEYPLPPDPLAPAGSSPNADEIVRTLRSICERVSDETSTTMFLASDVDIPTKREVSQNALDEPGMAVIDQSIAFARASDGNAFVFTKAGLTTGAGAEAGAIPEHFDLRRRTERSRDPRTFCIFAEAEESSDDRRTYEPKFSSASIDEMDDAYDLRFRYFVDRTDLVDKLVDFVESYVVPLSDRR